ncbi:methyltransferase-like protein 27 [Haliotis rubra]|uniref:methyltransferase-like protein 27 n=1 Tax=Haliotis rubra TaxID=36100 RepID=UPI001EE56B55|nr:methyltransferase-like protein 27 [Haliotis rubra]
MTSVYSSHYNEDDKAKAQDIMNQITDRKVNSEVVFDRYSQISQDYEKVMGVVNYNGPKETAATVAKLFPSNRNNVCMLDVAAGTGLCASELNKYNFMELDALDASEGMLSEAKKKGLYGRYIIDVLGDNDLDIKNDTYDAVIICGLSTDIMRQLPIKAFETLIRIVKRGGYVVNTGFYTSFTNGQPDTEDFRRRLRTLESQGKWKQMEVRRFHQYLQGRDGAVSVHKIC